MKIAHRMDHDKIDWNSFRFMVFDIPTSKKDYNQRYQQLRTNSRETSAKLNSLNRARAEWEESSLHSSSAIPGV